MFECFATDLCDIVGQEIGRDEEYGGHGWIAKVEFANSL